ncbi:sensor domain-containing phosphodiesterase [Sulfurospirillum arcachonense]|uniref:sensor domain-containing phosphodiesterase n=1 Tax=Sulfurospirillum arcachonense TaxID=57666 RepID=UPI0004BA4F19|nr:EAL domain-containing protein [Sulfurospirillum arcachonense]
MITFLFNLINFSIFFIISLFTLVIIELFLIKTKIIQKDNDIETISPQTYLEAFENNAIFAKLNVNHNIIQTNRQFCQIIHKTKEECQKMTLKDLFHSDAQEILETLKYKQSWDGVQTIDTPDGNKIHLNCSFIPIFNNNEGLKEILFLATDITELTLSKTNIKNSLYQDSLTKLPNRLKLFTDKSILNSKNEATYIIFNIDSFDTINNLYGNLFGDKILLQFSKWLENNLLTDKSKLYKFEADIYVMVNLEKIQEKELLNYLRNVSQAIIKEKFLCNGTEIEISMTIGASQGRINQLKLAQIAYKDAKLTKKSFAIYDIKSNKEEEYTKNIQVSKVLKNAIDQDLVLPYFQPIMNINTGEIEKYESLMRVQDEKGNILIPYEFLDIAKRSKIYPKLSCSLIKKSIDTFSICPCEFSVNLSYLDITNKATRKFILNTLEETGIGPWIIFELLESEGIENYKEVMNFIQQVKSYGAKIAIDDFGSGYSNFERIVELQVDFIKIDGSLIKNIDQNDDMVIIARTIVNFAKELGIKTVAEYVHSQEVFDKVKDLGVDYAQGFFIGKPNEHI